MTKRRTALAALGSLSLAVCSTSAFGEDFWTSEDGSSALEVHAFYKTLGNAVAMQANLVEQTRRLETLTDEARLQLDPEGGALLPDVHALPRYGVTLGSIARAWSRLALSDRIEIDAGWELEEMVASDRVLLGGGTVDGGLPLSASSRARRRLVDFDPVLARRGGLLLEHNLDLLALEFHSDAADLTLGRQVLSWGSGRLWNPTDLLSPFAPSDIDREVRHGVDAVRVSIPLGATAEIDALWLAQSRARDQGGVVRARSNVGDFDIAPSVAKYVRDAVFGLDVTGDIGSVGVHGEAAWTLAFDRNRVGRRDSFLRAVTGFDVRPTEDLALTGEYYFNGWGAADPSGYLAVLGSDRVTRGEVFGAGRHYLGLVAAWQLSELVTLQPIVITNLGDPSVLVIPAFEYWAEQHILLRFGGYLPLGASPDPSAVLHLDPRDVSQRTPAWRNATASLGLKSEYGASPWGVYSEVVVNLL